MQEKGIYFGTKNFYNIIQKIGGQWNDSKERPLVCLVKSTENEDLYWAIPLGNWNHRTPDAQARIIKYLNYPDADIRSCFYHVGNTDTKSIFFITDAVPITNKYIDRAYIGKYTGKPFIIKNKTLLAELQRKLRRILAWENANPNYYRQHITDIKRYLLEELEQEQKTPS